MHNNLTSNTPLALSSSLKRRLIPPSSSDFHVQNIYDPATGSSREVIVIDDDPHNALTIPPLSSNLSSPAAPIFNTNSPIPPPIVYPHTSFLQHSIPSLPTMNHHLLNPSAQAPTPSKRRRRNLDLPPNSNSYLANNPSQLVPPDHFLPVKLPVPTSADFVPPCDDKDGHYIITSGDVLLNSYSIVKLLGQGTFGKVAECIDMRTNRRVAVKIVRAIQKYHDAAVGEIRVLNTLRCADLENRHQCVQLLSEFDFKKHKCMIFPLLGPSLFDFLKDNQFQPFTLAQVRELAIQLIDSVAFLHKLKIVHTDLKPENILLLSADSIKCAPLTTHLNMSRKVHPKSYQSQRMLKSYLIRVIDFGSATFDNEYKSSVVSTRHYRAPEIMLELGWSFPCDMWSIGCILVELLIGEALFQTHENVEHLAMMEMILGMFQDELVTRSRKRSVWFHPPELVSGGPCSQQVRVCKVHFPAPETKRDARTFVRSLRTLKEICDTPGRSRQNAGVVLIQHPSPNVNATDFTPPPADLVPSFTQFHSLIQRLLIFDPVRRLSARQALTHPFFDGIVHPLLRKRTAGRSVHQQQPQQTYAFSSPPAVGGPSRTVPPPSFAVPVSYPASNGMHSVPTHSRPQIQMTAPSPGSGPARHVDPGAYFDPPDPRRAPVQFDPRMYGPTSNYGLVMSAAGTDPRSFPVHAINESAQTSVPSSVLLSSRPYYCSGPVFSQPGQSPTFHHQNRYPRSVPYTVASVPSPGVRPPHTMMPSGMYPSQPSTYPQQPSAYPSQSSTHPQQPQQSIAMKGLLNVPSPRVHPAYYQGQPHSITMPPSAMKSFPPHGYMPDLPATVDPGFPQQHAETSAQGAFLHSALDQQHRYSLSSLGTTLSSVTGDGSNGGSTISLVAPNAYPYTSAQIPRHGLHPHQSFRQ